MTEKSEKPINPQAMQIALLDERLKRTRVAWNKGKKMSAEKRKKMSKRSYLRFKNPAERLKISLSHKRGDHIAGYAKQSDTLKKRYAEGDLVVWNKGLTKNDPRVEKYSSSLKGRKLSLTHRKNLSEAMKGRKAWNKGVHRPWLSILNKDPRYRSKMLKGLIKRPTAPENRLITLINTHHLPLRYVGDGSLIIGTLNPDFVHNNQKKIVEVFGRIYHDPVVSPFSVRSCLQEQPRINIYQELGYRCLVVWEEEIENEEKLLSKIKMFVGN